MDTIKDKKKIYPALSSEEMLFLSQFDRQFTTAVFHDYCRALPSHRLQEINRIYQSATGRAYRLNVNCASCVLAFMQEAGRVYLYNRDRQVAEMKEKEKEKEAENERRQAEASQGREDDKRTGGGQAEKTTRKKDARNTSRKASDRGRKR